MAEKINLEEYLYSRKEELLKQLDEEFDGRQRKFCRYLAETHNRIHGNQFLADTYRKWIRIFLGKAPHPNYVNGVRQDDEYRNPTLRNHRAEADIVKSTRDNEQSWMESKEGAVWEYSGTESIQTLDQAIQFCEVDLTEFEVDTYHFKSWDVNMKQKVISKDDPTKLVEKIVARTNYYAHVKFKKIIPLNILRPKLRKIKVKATKKAQMFVIIGCVHRPFHNKVLWDRFLNFLTENKSKIDGFVINGDYLDLRSLSTHEDWIPKGLDLSVEYSDGLQGIEEIESCLKKSVKKYFNYGNHEDRFWRNKKDSRKYGSALMTPTKALELEERGWEVNEDWKNGFITLGNDLDIYHGTKVGVNAASDQLKALPNRNHIFNHTHRFSTASNRTHAAYNTGCMIDRNHEMFHYVDRGTREGWANGFAVAYIDNKGKCYVTPIKCENNSFFFEGKIY